MILGIIEPNNGKVEKMEGITVGYSPETPYFQPFLRAKEIMEFFSKLQKLDRNIMDNEIDNLLEKVGLL